MSLEGMPDDEIRQLEDEFRRTLWGAYGSAGNTKLMRVLGWTEEKYREVRGHLLAAGVIQLGHGRGGSVHLVVYDGPPRPDPNERREAKRLAREAQVHQVGPWPIPQDKRAEMENDPDAMAVIWCHEHLLQNRCHMTLDSLNDKLSIGPARVRKACRLLEHHGIGRIVRVYGPYAYSLAIAIGPEDANPDPAVDEIPTHMEETPVAAVCWDLCRVEEAGRPSIQHHSPWSITLPDLNIVLCVTRWYDVLPALVGAMGPSVTEALRSRDGLKDRAEPVVGLGQDGLDGRKMAWLRYVDVGDDTIVCSVRHGAWDTALAAASLCSQCHQAAELVVVPGRHQ